MDMNNKQSKKGQTKDLRRPFGVSVLHISVIVQGNVIEDEDKEYFLHIQKKYKFLSTDYKKDHKKGTDLFN